MKEDPQKALKKLSLFFHSIPVPFNGQSYQKQKGSGTSHHLLFRQRKKFIPLFPIYYLTKFDDKCKDVFELFHKLHLQIYAIQFMT